jgi:hypothetical protein
MIKKRRLRITNHTRWSTRSLRTLITAGMNHVGVTGPKHFSIEYRTRRTPGCSHGEAAVGRQTPWHDGAVVVHEAINVQLYLPRVDESLSVVQLAQVIEHELMHTRGWKHRDMVPHWSLPVPWAEGYAVAWCPPPPKPTHQQATAAVQREARARRHVARLEAQALRTARLLAKWRARVRYYDRKAAASTKPPKEDP